MGIRQLVLVVNKMDLIDCDQRAFERISEDFVALAQELGIERLTAVLVSALRGENAVISAVEMMHGIEGSTLLQAIEAA